MTPAERAAAMIKAKRAAVAFTAAVRSGSAHQVARATAGFDRDDWAALAVVLAESCDPHRLRAVTETSDDGLPVAVVAARSEAA